MLSFSIWVTQKCNLKCKYCYEKNNIDRSMEDHKCEISDIVMFIQSKVERHSARSINVAFHGGEPLLEFELIKSYIKILNSTFNDINITYSMTTNGLLLDREKVKYLKSNVDYLSVSIDGISIAHDLNRISADGRGSYDRVMYNIEKSGLDKENVRIRMTVTANNVMYLSESIDDLILKGFVCLVPAVALEDTKWNKEKFELLEKQLKEVKEKYSDCHHINIAMTDKNYMRKKTECLGGIKNFNIMQNGDIYPCEFVTGNKQFCMGNVRHDNIDINKLKEIYTLGGCDECSGCTYQPYCESTRCKYINIINTGDFNIPPDNLCAVENVKYRVYNYEVLN